MGLDSVELVMEWEDFFNLKIPDLEASKMRTIADAVNYNFASVSAEEIKFSFLIIIELFDINLALVSADEFQFPVLRQALAVSSKFHLKAHETTKNIISNFTYYFNHRNDWFSLWYC